MKRKIIGVDVNLLIYGFIIIELHLANVKPWKSKGEGDGVENFSQTCTLIGLTFLKLIYSKMFCWARKSVKGHLIKFNILFYILKKELMTTFKITEILPEW